MTFPDPAKEIQARAALLAKSINAALAAHYATAPSKKADQIAVSVSTSPESAKARTPAQQAALVLAMKSWTCNSAHMSDAGRHIMVRISGVPTWKLSQLKKNDNAAFNVMVKQWNTGMKAQDLRNHGGGKSFEPFGNDPLHVELSNARLNNTDPRVTQCLEIYANATRLGGKKQNVTYETNLGSVFQKAWLQNYDKKLAAKRKGPARPVDRPCGWWETRR